MRKLLSSSRVVLGCILILQSACPFAAESGKPAGVVAYSCVAGNQLVLLAYDGAWRRHGWGSFGGTPSNASEPVHETASREFHEETGCVFSIPRPGALSNLDYSVSRGFYTYVYEVPYVPVDVIEASACGEKDLRSDWIWIDATDLQQALDQPDYRIPAPGNREIELWDLARNSMVKAVEDGILDLSPDTCR